MAPSERIEIHRGPCPCGRGQILIDRLSPDQMYSSSYTEERIACPECSTAYEIRSDGQAPGWCLVRTADVAERLARSRVVQNKRAEIEQSIVKPTRAEAQQRVQETGRTKKDWFKNLGLLVPSVIGSIDFETFERETRRPAGFDGWMVDHITVENIAAVVEELHGFKDPVLTRNLAELRALQLGARLPLERLALPSRTSLRVSPP